MGAVRTMTRFLLGLGLWAAWSCLIPNKLHAQSIVAQPFSPLLQTDPAVGNIQGVQRYGRQLRTDPDHGEGSSYHVYPITGFGTAGFADSNLGTGTALQSAIAPFDWTSGIRNFGVPNAPENPDSSTQLQAGSLTRAGRVTNAVQIYHQPLIQIKLRVVEVARRDGLAVGSLLEYVGRDDVETSLTSGATANRQGMQGFENLRSISRLINADIATTPTRGRGSFTNLTSEHINLLLQGLATELSADVITAPEVVTLNGQNVEFISGEKLPFELGTNVLQGFDDREVDQVFYKHVGTMVSVTPRIVSWGYHGEGQGEATIQANEIRDWPALIETMITKGIVYRPWVPETPTDKPQRDVSIEKFLEKYRNQRLIPFSAQTEILLALNNYSRANLQLLPQLAELEIIDDECCQRCRSWRPNECVIDLAVVVRLSEGIPKVPVPEEDEEDEDVALSSLQVGESNIRAVANVIQVASGHGVVMAGLIGEREINEADKVPVLGDLPLVGFLFRNKVVAREKTEVLIFIEAEVLESDPNVARAQSAADFVLGAPFVEGHLRENPLEVGMCRIGFGTYLPPHTKGERLFWKANNRSIRKIHSHIDDALEP